MSRKPTSAPTPKQEKNDTLCPLLPLDSAERQMFTCLFNRLFRHAHDMAVAKGWYDRPREAPELIALCHSELSECLEALRNGNPESEKIPCSQAEEELADLIIRVMDMATSLGLEYLGTAIIAKMQYNATRPRRHGNKVY